MVNRDKPKFKPTKTPTEYIQPDGLFEESCSERQTHHRSAIVIVVPEKVFEILGVKN